MMRHVWDVWLTARRRTYWQRVMALAGMLGDRSFTTLRRIVNPDVIDVNHDESSNSAT
ncbi:carbohydrate kinase [Salmonella enterica subsp. arizonae]|uniref:Carbohydrate kinase n=1 Tax=Salmonella enterica subsp. arizonae TaxID=59203 RepID=A0A379S8R7_SALER|nr:carbohydrate kinase [Salmonella enterica subsp. arizonae]